MKKQLMNERIGVVARLGTAKPGTNHGVEIPGNETLENGD